MHKRRKLFPPGAIVEYPEDAQDDLVFVRRGPAALGTRRRIGNSSQQLIELFFRECQHAQLYESLPKMVLR
jgi:hypothetical protein